MTRHRRTVDVSIPAPLRKRVVSELGTLVEEHLAPQGFAGSYLKAEIFSKYLDPSIVSPERRAAAAKEKFLAAEARNARTNFRLFFDEARDGVDFGWTTSTNLVRCTQKLIHRVLGPVPYPQVLCESTHTNGASTRVRRSPKAAVVKLTGGMHITNDALKHWFAMASGSRLSGQELVVVDGSELFTVPKKTEIDRVACKEPEGNSLLQRSVGIYFRRRLRKIGINLLDQTRNQKLAQRAVADGLATIDLSSASDTISLQIVRMLLPPEWFDLLCDLRSPVCQIDGEAHTFEMISSMGNGFTFELETLIFWALAKATQRITYGSSAPKEVISVYGDDIIVPSKWARRYLRVLSYFGFTPNAKKTHITGPFRESCGAHWYRGLDVKPFYLRKEVATIPELINVLNRLLEWDGRGWGFFVTREAYEFWLRWSVHVPCFLHGGLDPDDPTALVTGDPPRKRLVPVYKDQKVDQKAALTTWLHRGDRRDHWGPDLDVLAVDPQEAVAYRVSRILSCGERSTWRPGLLADTWGELGTKA